ncbi:MAG: S24/S26 family peptidase [Nostocoides sp.]
MKPRLSRVTLGVVRVAGRSMEPTLYADDLLVVAWGAEARPGGLVIVALPPESSGASRPLSVKRLRGADPEDATRWWVERDNPNEGVDSWLVGSVPTAALRARVLARLPRFGRRVTRSGGPSR